MAGMVTLRRREFLGAAVLPWLGSCASGGGVGQAELPVAALITAYYPVSHADVIASKILEGYLRNGGMPRPGLKLVSMYVEQQHPHDISGELCVGMECGCVVRLTRRLVSGRLECRLRVC